MAHVDPLDEVLALVAQRQVRVPITPGTLASEELDVDLAASVAAALLCRATDQLGAHEG